MKAKTLLGLLVLSVGCETGPADVLSSGATDASTVDGGVTLGTKGKDSGVAASSDSDAARPPARSDAAVGESLETQCDGIDNDGNGIVDDVDTGGDGVCDCLLTATLGRPASEGPGDVFASWLATRSSNGAVSLTDQVLTADLLKTFQVIVVQNVTARAYSDAEVEALRQWVADGGGLIALTGYGPLFETVNVNKLLAPTGIQYNGLPVLFGGPAPATLPITEWMPHPVSMMVKRVGFNNGYEVGGTGDVIARSNGIVVLRAAEPGNGKVLAWGDEWITINSEWKEHPDYDTERFWLNMLKWLSPPLECQVPIVFL